MQGRIYIRPLLSSSGTKQAWQEVTNDVLEGHRFTQRTERNKWTHGLLAVGDGRLLLSNKSGRYGATSEPNSIFALAGADYAEARLDYPTARDGSDYRTIWRGLVSSKGSSQMVDAGGAELTTRTPDAVLREALISPGSVAVGQNATEMLTRIFSNADIVRELPTLNLTGLFDPNARAGGTTLADEAALLGERGEAVEVVQQLLAALDATFAYDSANSTAYIARRAAPNALPSAGTINDIISIDRIEDGSEFVFNQVVAKTGIDSPNQREYKTRNEGSISRWGLRSLAIDLAWLRDLEKIGRLADNLRDRLSTPQRVVELSIDGWELPPAGVFVGAQVRLDVGAEASRRAPRWDDGSGGVGAFGYNLGAQYARPVHGRIYGDFYIESLARDLRLDALDLRLREII